MPEHHHVHPLISISLVVVFVGAIVYFGSGYLSQKTVEIKKETDPRQMTAEGRAEIISSLFAEDTSSPDDPESKKRTEIVMNGFSNNDSDDGAEERAEKIKMIFNSGTGEI